MSAEPNAAHADPNGGFTSFEQIGATLTGVSDGLTTAFMQLEELQGALRAGCRQLQQREARLEQAEQDLARRSAELQSQTEQIQQAQHAVASQQEEVAQLRASLDEQREQLAAREAELAAAATAVAEQQAQLEQARTAAAQALAEAQEREARLAELEQRAAELSRREQQELEQRRAIEAERTAVEAQRAALEASAQSVAAREAQVEQRLRDIEIAQALLTKRHEAVARFQRAFSEMAASLGAAGPKVPDFSSLPGSALDPLAGLPPAGGASHADANAADEPYDPGGLAAAGPSPVIPPAAEGAAAHATPESALEELLAATEADAFALNALAAQPNA
ncbi:MAG TPA: hypothetical protein PKC49_07485, partial [Phycisphaerae bacterium]|nr:hypothetical protein [Phycisphaerae bacterium]